MEKDRVKRYEEKIEEIKGDFSFLKGEISALLLKADILSNHLIVWANNLPDLYEYFYHFRKLWMEQKHRQYFLWQYFFMISARKCQKKKTSKGCW